MSCCSAAQHGLGSAAADTATRITASSSLHTLRPIAKQPSVAIPNAQADDPELEAIRQRRMQQLMGQYGGSGGQVRLPCHC